MPHDPPGLFITGTDTGVGKTYVAALIAGRWSPRAGGSAFISRRPAVALATPRAGSCRTTPSRFGKRPGGRATWSTSARQRFLAPLAPHLAAREEGKTLDADLLRAGLEYWKARSDIVLVEGAGGLMSPMGDREYVADLALDFGYPLVVVARNILGTINATLQTLFTASHYRGGLCVAGVVLNHPAPPAADDASLATNRAELAAGCGAAVDHTEFGAARIRLRCRLVRAGRLAQSPSGRSSIAGPSGGFAADSSTIALARGSNQKKYAASMA